MRHQVFAIIGLILGCALILYWGGEAPGWLLKIECAVVMAVALGFGFTAYSPTAPEWTRDDAVRGVALVYAGVGIVFLSINLIASAFLIGCGLRLVCKSATVVTARVASGAGIGRTTGDIVIREAHSVRKL